MNKESYQLSRKDWKLSKIFRYQLLAIACCVLAIAFSVPAVAVPSLQPISINQLQAGESDDLAFDAQIWGENGKSGDRQLLLRSIDNSLRYLDTSAAASAYSRYPVAGVTRDRVRRSLDRFRQLVVSFHNPSTTSGICQARVCILQIHGQRRQRNSCIYRLFRADLRSISHA